MKFLPTLGGEMSGSMGGIVASRNRGGSYFRRRRVPVNPNSPRQQLVRAAFGALVQAWTADLDDSQRDLWTGYAQGTPRTNTLGQTLILTGQQAFLSSNVPRLQADLPRVDDAPSILNTGEPVTGITTFIADDDPTTAISWFFDLAVPASEDGDALLFVGRPQNVSKNFFKGPYQLAAITPFSAAATTIQGGSDLTDPAEWFADFSPAIGQRIPLRIVLAYDDGRTSQAFAVIEPLAEPV